WSLATVEAYHRDNTLDLKVFPSREEKGETITKDRVPMKFVKKLRSFWRYMYQPTVPADLFDVAMTDLLNQLADAPLNPYAKGLIIPRGSKVYAIGDLHGDFFSLQRNLLDIFNKGSIDKDGQLTPSTFLVFTGDITDRGQ